MSYVPSSLLGPVIAGLLLRPLRRVLKRLLGLAFKVLLVGVFLAFLYLTYFRR